MYVSRKFEYKIRDDLTKFDKETYESLFIELQFQNTKNKIIGIIYRPPNNKFNKFEENLTQILECLNKENKDVYIIGDFNLNILKIHDSDYVNDFITQMYKSSFFPFNN